MAATRGSAIGVAVPPIVLLVPKPANAVAAMPSMLLIPKARNKPIGKMFSNQFLESILVNKPANCALLLPLCSRNNAKTNGNTNANNEPAVLLEIHASVASSDVVLST